MRAAGSRSRRTREDHAAAGHQGVRPIVVEADPRLGAAVVVARQDDEAPGAAECHAAAVSFRVESRQDANERVSGAFGSDSRRAGVPGMEARRVREREDAKDRAARILETARADADGPPERAGEQAVTREQADLVDEIPGVPRRVTRERYRPDPQTAPGALSFRLERLG